MAGNKFLKGLPQKMSGFEGKNKVLQQDFGRRDGQERFTFLMKGELTLNIAKKNLLSRRFLRPS